MKVISMPDVASWRTNCTCEQCKTEMEASAEDVQHAPSSGGNVHDYQPSYLYVECPTCAAQVIVGAHTVPFMVMKQAKERSDPR